MKLKRSMAIALLMIMLISTPAMAASFRSRQVISVAMKQLGKPYALYSDAPNSFNCASFVAYCCNQVASGTFSKSGIAGQHKRISSIGKVQTGDVLCFKTSGSERGVLSYHFGIYVGKGYFIHASNSAERVIVSKVRDYAGRFLGAMRVF